MSDHTNDNEKFLSRWSRLKRDAVEAEPNAAAPLDENRNVVAPLPHQHKEAHEESAPPLLPPVDELTPDSDFRGFLHPKVDEDVKRAALKKLFSDPRFNVMDGLDIYIDDYSKPDPLPLDMLAQMKSAQKIFCWAKNEGDEENEGESSDTPTSTAPAPRNVEAPPALEVSVSADGSVPSPEVPRVVEKPEPQPAALDATSPDLEAAAPDKN
jgi:hypothetical protein